MKARILLFLFLAIVYWCCKDAVTDVAKPKIGMAPVILSDSVYEISFENAILNAVVDPGGNSLRCRFEYGTTTSLDCRLGDHVIGSDSRSITVQDTLRSLAANTVYYCRIVCSTGTDTLVGRVRMFETTTIPYVITDGATDIGETSVVLHARVNPAHVDFCYFEIDGGGTSIGLDVTGSDSSLVAIQVGVYDNLYSGTTYHYRIVGHDSRADEFYFGNTSSFKTQGVYEPHVPPTVYTDAPSVLTDHSVVLKGRVNPNGGNTTYYFELNGSFYTSTSSQVTPGQNSNGTNSISFSDTVTNLSPGWNYSYRATAFNKGGQTWGNYQSFTTPSTMVEFDYALTVGTVWTYEYNYDFQYSPQSESRKGIRRWEILSKSTWIDSTIYTVENVPTDTVVYHRLMYSSSTGTYYDSVTTWIDRDTSYFSIIVSLNSINTQWPATMKITSANLINSQTIPRYVPTGTGTFSIENESATYAVASYTNGSGLVSYSGRYGNITHYTESLSLISILKK